MKKFISIFTLVITAIAFGACSDELESKNDFRARKLRSQDEAIAIAKNAYSEFNTKDSRSVSKVNIDKNGVHVIKGRSSRGQASDTLMYVVNYEDSLGFALVSASTNSLPLIGIAEHGYYDPANPDDNENFNYFIDCANEYLALADSYGDIGGGGNWPDPPSDPIGPVGPNPTFVAPKIPVLWGQGAPYGALFSNNLAGCANTATAQIMAYFRKPESMTLTYLESSTPPRVDFDWDQMLLHKQTYTQCNEVELHMTHYMLRSLFRQIGYETYSTSYIGVTTTSGDNALNSLTNHGYSCTPIRPFAEVNYKNYLQGNYIMYVFGLSISSSIGHIWLMDGYKVITGTTYCHYNWGWDGDSNGYFASNVFDTTAAYSYDRPNNNTANWNFDDEVTLSAVTY